jgi:hypothetical protein
MARGATQTRIVENIMKFVCLGYMDENKWKAMSRVEREAMLEECFAYDDVLRRNGHWAELGEALQSVRTAKTLRSRGGQVLVTDGPFAETKEQLGGFGVLEARDMEHAVELMSKHPGARLGGPFEIRPINEEMGERCRPVPGGSDTAGKGMKFVCLGYGDERNWSELSPAEREAMIEECVKFGEVIRKQGGWVDGVALQSVAAAKTLRSRGGKVLVTDGPYAETKEQLGGVATLKFRDMDHAVEAWSRHPCLRVGDVLEIRPADEEFGARVAARWEHGRSK